MKLKYFGTDGIRGSYGTAPINEQFATQFARGLVRYLAQQQLKSSTIVIGRDTRVSGKSLTEAYVQTFTEYGYDVVDLGIVPTPQVSFAVNEKSAILGIAITASHNPAEDNGFKLFNATGTKFTPEQELQIEAQIDSTAPIPPVEQTGSVTSSGKTISDAYFKRLDNVFNRLNLAGLKIAIDTANGATVKTSPAYLESKGAEIIGIANTPTGSNINDQVGSEHPEKIAQTVKEHSCDIGIAHDGDGDRVILLDSAGQPLSGEHFMAIISKYGVTNATTEKHPLITTIQSNLALDHFVSNRGFKTIRTPVGDRNVVYEMLANHASFGGENSGHYVFSDVLPTGDGLVAALKILEILQQTGKSIAELRSELTLFPSTLVNLKIAEKKPLESLPNLSLKKLESENELGNKGRILLRYSGTENKLRILIECESEELLSRLVSTFTTAAKIDLEVIE